MKKVVLFLAGMLSVPAFAADYAWTGGGSDTSSWNDAANWEPQGVPGGGDAANFSKDAFIADGLTVVDGELRINAQGDVTVEISGVISGAGGVYFCADKNSGTSKIILSGQNTFTGKARLYGNSDASKGAGVYLRSPVALGSGRMVSVETCNVFFDCDNAVFNYDFVPGQNTSCFLPLKRSTLDGSIFNPDVKTTLWLRTRDKNANLAITGMVGGNADSAINVRMHNTGEPVISFQGGVSCKSISMDALGSGSTYNGIAALGGKSAIKTLQIAHGSYRMLSADAFSDYTVLNFDKNSYSQGHLDLNGFDQTVNCMKSVSYSNSDNGTTVKSTTPAVLRLKSTESAVAMVAMNGNVSLVMDADDPSVCQMLSNRVSSTSGDLIVSNGVLRIGKKATFKNVPRIIVADGGVFEVESEETTALGGVTEIFVEDGGRLVAPAAAFELGTVNLVLGENAEIGLSCGGRFNLASLVVAGRRFTSGEYATENIPQLKNGSLRVMMQASANASGVWLGAGASESTLDSANWEGGYPYGITLTFARAGSRALLGESILAEDLVFDYAQNVRSFSILPDVGSPDSLISFSGDITMTEGIDGNWRTNTVAVPLASTAAKTFVRVDGVGNRLDLTGSLQPIEGTRHVLYRDGTGEVRFYATNSIFSGKVIIAGGINRLKGWAFGGTEAAAVDVSVNPHDNSNGVRPSGIDLYFDGGVYSQNFEIIRGGANALNTVFAAASTNVINGFLRLRNNYALKIEFAENSDTTVKGGLEETWANGYSPIFNLYQGARLEIANSPLRMVNNATSAKFYSYALANSLQRSELVFSAVGNMATNGLFVGGYMKVIFATDFAFDADSNGIASPLSLMRVPGDAYCNNVCIVDLQGHSQRFGSLRTVPASENEYGYQNYWGHSSKSYITSDEPATMYVVQNGKANDAGKPWYPTFRGAVSLVKSGTNTLALAGVSTTTGRLEVAEGRIEFTGDGSWAQAGEVAVSGGTLALDRRGRIGLVDLTVGGGTVEVAAGVRQRVKSLKVLDGEVWRNVNPGRYCAERLPDVVSGGGSIVVINAGTRIIVR